MFDFFKSCYSQTIDPTYFEIVKPNTEQHFHDLKSTQAYIILLLTWSICKLYIFECDHNKFYIKNFEKFLLITRFKVFYLLLLLTFKSTESHTQPAGKFMFTIYIFIWHRYCLIITSIKFTDYSNLLSCTIKKNYVLLLPQMCLVCTLKVLCDQFNTCFKVLF